MLSDLRYAFRQLVKTPGFTAVVVLSLALGIGGSTTVFCWLQSIWLHPLPGVSEQGRMFVVTHLRGTSLGHTCSLPDVRDMEKQKDIFAGVVGSQVSPACLGVDRQQAWVYGQIATANFFEVLGVRPILGRTFLPNEDQQTGGDAVLVISETLWRRRFGADPSVIGRSVELNRRPFTIIGVVPAEFHGTMSGLACDFWAPVSMHQEVANWGSLTRRDTRSLHTQVRLQPGVTLARAQAALTLLAQQWEQAYPSTNKGIGFRIMSLADAPYGIQPVLLPVLEILLGVSLGVLLIVVTNVAHLLLARSSERQKEIAIRLAVGASRSQLVRQLLIESLLLAGLGGIAGTISTFWMVDLLHAMSPPSPLPIGIALVIDWKVLVSALVLTLGSGVAAGLMPAWQSTRPDLNVTLKGCGGGGAGHSHRRWRHMLVVAQIALALTLLVGAGLCIRSANRARESDFGFDPDHALLTGLRIGMNGYDEPAGRIFYRQIQQRLAAVPGVINVALASWFPLGFEGCSSRTIAIDGYLVKPGEDMNALRVVVSPGYFATMKTALLEGREFTDQDDMAAARVVIINEALARRFWPGQSALGRKFFVEGKPRTVVGIAQTGKYRSLNEADKLLFYVPYGQGVSELDLGLVVRTQGDPAAFFATLREEIHRTDPSVEIWSIISLRDYMKAAYLAPVLASRLLTGMGLIALALAAMGVYAIMAFSVGERRREFGLRMALGATPGGLLSLVLKNSVVLCAWGLGLGMVLAVAVGRLLASFLYDISPFDPLTFLGVPLILTVTALVASYIPARRAARVDPCASLRSE